MRTWRKVYSTILDSEQVSQLSDGAAVLLTLLIVAQDDTGYWPWSPTKVRRLITSRPNWSIGDAQAYANELVAVGVAEWAGGGIVLLNGHNLNGTPRSDSKAEITPRIEGATPCIESVTPCNEPAPLEKIREDKSRSDLEEGSQLLSQPPTEEQVKKRAKALKGADEPTGEQLHEYIAAIVDSFGYNLDTYKKSCPGAYAQARQAFKAKVSATEIRTCAERVNREDPNFGRRQTVEVALIRKKLASAECGPVNGQKGNGNGGIQAHQRNTARDVSGIDDRESYDEWNHIGRNARTARSL